MTALVAAWYGWLASLAQGPILAVEGWIDWAGLPVVSALLFGLLGALSPCQLTTNLSALALSARRDGGAGALGAAGAYVAGKVAVYSVVGAAAVGLGLELQAASIPVVLIARKLLGPLMLVVGLGMLGAIRLRGGFGQGLAGRLAGMAEPNGIRGPFLLGVAFSFAFCPTLMWLFFGLTVPLALRSAGGWGFPGVFAIGTALPLLVLSAGVTLGLGATAQLAGGVKRAQAVIGRVAGVVFVVAGLHDTVVYWWL